MVRGVNQGGGMVCGLGVGDEGEMLFGREWKWRGIYGKIDEAEDLGRRRARVRGC